MCSFGLCGAFPQTHQCCHGCCDQSWVFSEQTNVLGVASLGQEGFLGRAPHFVSDVLSFGEKEKNPHVLCLRATKLPGGLSQSQTLGWIKAATAPAPRATADANTALRRAVRPGVCV